MIRTAKIGIAAVLFLMGISVSARAVASGECVNQGQVLENMHFKSVVLGREVNYAVYLPPDYQTSTRRYPVVYLLHGLAGNESSWIQFGEVHLAMDQAIAAREIPPMIVVMPDGSATWYINDYQNKIRFEDMFFQEFIPHIDSTLRTRPDRKFRGVAGQSMGGWGALVYVLRHPDLFAACAAFSAGISTDDEIVSKKQNIWDEAVGHILGTGLTGKDRLTPHFRKHNPLDLAKTLPEESLNKVRIYIDCGDDDSFFKGNAALSVALLDRKIPHEFRVRDGGHTWDYWRTGIVEGLKFIGTSFRR